MNDEAKFWQDCLDGEHLEQDAMPVHPVEIAIVIGILVIAAIIGWVLW